MSFEDTKSRVLNIEPSTDNLSMQKLFNNSLKPSLYSIALLAQVKNFPLGVHKKEN